MVDPHLQAGQSVLAHGAAGAVGTMVTQLARKTGADVIGTGRAADRENALDFGAHGFVGLENDAPGKTSVASTWCSRSSAETNQKRSATLIRAGGTLVTVVGPPEARPADGLAVDFVVEADRAQKWRRTGTGGKPRGSRAIHRSHRTEKHPEPQDYAWSMYHWFKEAQNAIDFHWHEGQDVSQYLDWSAASKLKTLLCNTTARRGRWDGTACCSAWRRRRCILRRPSSWATTTR